MVGWPCAESGGPASAVVPGGYLPPRPSGADHVESASERPSHALELAADPARPSNARSWAAGACIAARSATTVGDGGSATSGPLRTDGIASS